MARSEGTSNAGEGVRTRAFPGFLGPAHPTGCVPGARGAFIPVGLGVPSHPCRRPLAPHSRCWANFRGTKMSRYGPYREAAGSRWPRVSSGACTGAQAASSHPLLRNWASWPPRTLFLKNQPPRYGRFGIRAASARGRVVASAGEGGAMRLARRELDSPPGSPPAPPSSSDFTTATLL